ncbi:MAG TPA: hypothetical protein VF170_16310 [Planctomycetaceae bacterium]
MPRVYIDLDWRTVERLEAEACRRGVDLGTAAAGILREHLGTTGPAAGKAVDLESLAGTWSDEEAKAFLEAGAAFRRVDRR